MRLRNILTIILAVWALQSLALDVTNTAGNLNQAVTDLNITTLKVTGTMDANDFYFIADNLRGLKSIDLTDVTVVACHTAQMHFSKREFNADEVPVGALASLPLTSVKLPAGLKRIGNAALADCQQLAQIDLPSALQTIGDYAFANCTALTAITLPASVTQVGSGAFMRCGALKSFAVAPSGQLQVLGDFALMDCPALTSISLGNAIKRIGSRALTGTGLQTLDLNANTALQEVGDWAMTLTPVTTAKLPDNVKLLGEGTFLYDNLSSITMGQRLATVGDYAFAGTPLQGKLTFTGLETLGNYALYNTQAVTAVELPATTQYLGERAMAGMIGLTELTSYAETPPSLGFRVWGGVKQSEIPLTVPKGSVDLYKAADQWQQFFFPNQWLRGDVNNDGSVNISDINVIVSIILGARVDNDTMQRADVNEDGTVNISDINLLLSIILNPTSKVMLSVDTQDQLHLPDVNVIVGEQTTVAVSLDNAADYSALQCDITLPQGLTLVSGTCPEGYVMYSSPIDESTTRIAIYSPQVRHFDGDAPVFTLTLSADAPLADESEMLLTDAVIAGGFEGWHPADCAARVNSASHVAELTADQGRVWVENRTLCIEVSEETTAMITTISGISRQLTLTAGVNRFDVEPGFYVVVVTGRSHKIAIQL